MTSRGKALNGKYQGIYIKEKQDGTETYSVRVKFVDAQGIKREKERRGIRNLREAMMILKKLQANRTLGDFKKPGLFNSTSIPLKQVATSYLISKEDKVGTR